MTHDEMIEAVALAIRSSLLDPDDDEAEYIARAILPIIRRRELEAGEKVKEAAATVKPSNTPASECETTGQWTRRTLRESIRALDVAAIIGDSYD